MKQTLKTIFYAFQRTLAVKSNLDYLSELINLFKANFFKIFFIFLIFYR